MYRTAFLGVSFSLTQCPRSSLISDTGRGTHLSAAASTCPVGNTPWSLLSSKAASWQRWRHTHSAFSARHQRAYLVLTLVRLLPVPEHFVLSSNALRSASPALITRHELILVSSSLHELRLTASCYKLL